MKKDHKGRGEFTVLTGDWSELKDRASGIRYQVFVKEQNVPQAIEMDDQDELCFHIVILDNNDLPVATARLSVDGKIGRMAVIPKKRGQGLGTILLSALLDQAAHRGVGKVYCHAQVHAVGFYEEMDFCCEGSVFEEAGIKHQAMYLDLRKS